MLKMICFLLVLAAAIPGRGEDGDTLMIWNFDRQQQLSQIYPVNAKGHAVNLKAAGPRTPNRESSLEVMVTQTEPNSPAHAKQLIFPRKATLEKDRAYRISFFCRASSEGEIGVAAAKRTAPHTALASGKSFPVGPEWKRIVYDFKPNSGGEIDGALPRISYAWAFKPGTKLWFGPVSLVQLPRELEFPVNGVWKVFRGVQPGLEPASFSAVPAALPGIGGEVAAKEMRLDEQVINLAAGNDAPVKSEALLFYEFDSPADGVMSAGAAADWWMQLCVNGKPVCDTLKTGNITAVYTPEIHPFQIPVRKGKNLLVARVIAGSGGWIFSIGPKKPGSSDNAPVKIEAGNDWKPAGMGEMYVRSGSALDLSGLVSREPAGTQGRVIVNAEGRLAFEQRPDEPVRFLAYVYHPDRREFKAMSDAELDAFADAIARQGYNMIRLHYAFLLVLEPAIGGKTIDQVPDSELTGDLPVNFHGTDRFDYFVAALKKRGIYINLDILGGAAGFTDANPYWVRDPANRFRLGLFRNPACRENWKKGMMHIIGRVNPYTGMRLADDPVLAVVEPFNEQEIQGQQLEFNALLPEWRTYLEKKYGSIDALNRKWGSTFPAFNAVPAINEPLLRAGNAASGDGGAFIQEQLRRMMEFYAQALNEAGYQGLMTQWDMIMRTMELPARAMLPVIAQHTYHCHPGTVEIGGKTVPTAGQSSSLVGSYLRSAAAARFVDRPFMITEYSHAPYNQYHHEQGLYFGAYAALQGWDSLAQHRDIVLKQPRVVSGFGNAGNPLARASDVVTAFAFLRGDVATSPHLVEYTLLPEKLFPKHLLAAVGDDYAQIALLTRIGIRFPGVEPLRPVGTAKPDVIVTPDEFSSLAVNLWYVSAATSYGNEFPKMVSVLRRKGILPPGNLTDPLKRIYQSDTGEITLQGKEQTMQVSASRLEGALLKQDAPVRLKQFDITGCSVPACVALASLENGKTLENSSRLLLIFSTRVANSGMAIQNQSIILDRGQLPVLVQTGRLRLKLRNVNSGFRLYPLRMDGSRGEEIPVKRDGDAFDIDLDTSKLPFGTPFFELTAGE